MVESTKITPLPKYQEQANHRESSLVHQELNDPFMRTMVNNTALADKGLKFQFQPNTQP